MAEILIDIFIFILLSLSVIGLIILIPVWVKASTESENNPNHIYNIFCEEAGSRGNKIMAASGCLIPFILIARPVFNPVNIIIGIAISIACALYHSSVYRGYPVLTSTMKTVGIFSIITLTTISTLSKREIISEFIIVYLAMFTGIVWGSYAVYKRARLIQAANAYSQNPH